MDRFSDVFIEIKQKNESGRENKILSESKMIKCKYGAEIEVFDIDSIQQSRYYHMNKGKYFLLSVKNVLYERKKRLLYYSKILSNRLRELYGDIDSKTKFLILGLGNLDIIADSLGGRVTKKIFITRNFKFETPNLPEVSVFNTNVLGVTGIESYDIAKNLIKIVKPDIVILIDSLCASSIDRLGKSFQISNIGLTPGAGVNNARKHFNFKNVKMISIGVPLVVFAKTYVENWLIDIINNSISINEKNINQNTIQYLKKQLKEYDFLENIVTPKDIDEMTKNCAYIISSAINKSIFDFYEM